MQYSTNYNLNLVEGTDIVNPLVIDKPNYVTIDGQMKANEDATVSTATEIKTGTVHALTRTNGDANVFRYVATAVCNAGDTFTVDGVSVTALLPTGEALSNNAYTIGCNVLAILTSTELTIFTGGGTASNAAMLNSQLPSYYLDAKNEGFDNTGTDLTATNTEAAIKELDSDIGDLKVNNIGTAVTLPNSPSYYVAPCDGYVQAYAQYDPYNYVYVQIMSSDGSGSPLVLDVDGGATASNSSIVFVRKGMRANVTASQGVHAAEFFPLIQ